MATYRFTIGDGNSPHETSEVECADLRSAKLLARRIASEALADAEDNFWSGDEITLDVQNGAGLLLFQIVILAIVAPAATISLG